VVHSLNKEAEMEVVEFGRVTPKIILRQQQVENEDNVSVNDEEEDDDGDTVDDIDEMTMSELKDLMMSLQDEDDGSIGIPDGTTLEEARDIVWSVVLESGPSSHFHSHSEYEVETSSTSVDRLGITNFVYKASRPFDTKKLLSLLSQWPVPIKDVLDLSLLNEAQRGGYAVDGKYEEEVSPFIGVLRSKGFCWLSPTQWDGVESDAWRHDAMMFLSHAGRHFGISIAGQWWATISKEQMKREHFNSAEQQVEFDRILREEFVTEEFGDRRQELVFIGVGLDQDKITEALDQCLLDDEGMHLYRKRLSTVSR
jgi:G3E family GTPase